METAGQRIKTSDMVYIAIFAALMAVCSWISIPMVVPFTLQTFGVFMAVGLLGGKRGTLAVLVYILLGAVGLPVFSGFGGGPGVLFGTTGGYIFGFLFSALVMWAMERLPGEKALPTKERLPGDKAFFSKERVPGKKALIRILSMSVGLLICYTVGTAWFMLIYGRQSGPVSLSAALMMCVVPFIIPDAAKIALAFILSNRLRRYIR